MIESTAQPAGYSDLLELPIVPAATAALKYWTITAPLSATAWVRSRFTRQT